MPLQYFVLPTDVSSVQVAAYEGVSTLSDNIVVSKTINPLRRGMVWLVVGVLILWLWEF